MTSKRDSANSNSSPRFEAVAVLLLLALLSAAAAWAVTAAGWTLFYGDAEAHLNIARRLTDSRTPNYEQIGTVWLPLPHLLMAPLALDDALWRGGLAGVIPSAAAFTLAGFFFFLAFRRALGRAAAWAGLAAVALNPNLLYLQSTPMTEPLLLASLGALLHFTLRYRDTQSRLDLALAAAAAVAGTLTRYEVWFLLPLATLYILWAARARRWTFAVVFGLAASLGILFWLAHNRIVYSDPLEFYRGPWSARAIYARQLAQGMARYPGDHDWPAALRQFRAAAVWALATPLFWLGAAGAAAALLKRALWPLLLLAAVPAFYILSIYSSGTPIYVPNLWPNSWYNTRYALAALPLAALGVAALVALTPARLRATAAVLAAAAVLAPWLAYPRLDGWICWKESVVNSEARRAWTASAAAYLQARYRPGDGILASFGDLTGILRSAGIPLRETIHEGNVAEWLGATSRPDLLLRAGWALAISGDRVSTALHRLPLGAPAWDRVRIVAGRNSPVIEIWRKRHDHPFHESARRAQ